MAPPELGQIIESVLYTSDVEQLAAWYRDFLSLHAFIESPAVVGFSRPNNTIPHGTETGPGQLRSFACSDADDLGRWREHFEVSRGGKFIYVKDWEGQVVEIHD
ncbi:hypothetical protein B0H66DRAFT_574982 [Apodospora peruviana]|uniref:VOC domain-containing protein n=1 Tax=Apodospora peruviana TaxID=516989 RepID=A0AAE0I3I9_9PEZI|nr:hypothetical protein B0H66DRAFT_574982 [Apodospora peruviana]